MNKKPVLVAGATSDIGKRCAHLFAADGHPIQLAARRPADLKPDAEDIAIRYNVPVSVHELDVLAPETIPAFFDALPEMPATVISAVGLMADQAVAEQDPAIADVLMRTNFFGAFRLLEEAAERLDRLEGPTAVVGISSVAGDRGRARNYWYGAAKAAFTAALSGLRQKYARSQVLVVTVKPGFVATRMTDGMDLPGPLVNSAEDIAAMIKKAVDRRRYIVMPRRWRLIMSILTHLPERIFAKLKF